MNSKNTTIFFIMKKVFYLFFKNFWGGVGQLSAVIGIVSAFAFWVWKPDFKVQFPIAVLLLALIFLVMLFWALGKTIHDLYTKCYDFSNTVIKFASKPDFLEEGLGLLVSKTYPWMSNSMVISIYHTNENIDTIIGIGEIIEIQNNGLAQILILDMEKKYLTHLKEGIGIKEIKIKPFADSRVFLRRLTWQGLREE